jgi:hypothetical protein
MELRKKIEYYSSGEIFRTSLIDMYEDSQGEHIEYFLDGEIFRKGFKKNDFYIGKYYHNGKYHFVSFTNPFNVISELEHKKELAMIRLGLIEEPIEFSYLLKDYDENGKIN